MTPAALTPLADDVWTWNDRVAWEGRPGVFYGRNGFAVRGGDGRIVLIDPPTITPTVVTALEELGPPALVLLTCGWHVREAASARARWACPVESPPGAPPPDGAQGTFPLDLLAGRLLPVPLPGVHWPDEVAFHVAGVPAVVIVGDAICGGRADLGVPDGEVGRFGPPRIEARAAATVLRQLLARPFEVLAFGHGSPIVSLGPAALERFVARLETGAC